MADESKNGTMMPREDPENQIPIYRSGGGSMVIALERYMSTCEWHAKERGAKMVTGQSKGGRDDGLRLEKREERGARRKEGRKATAKRGMQREPEGVLLVVRPMQNEQQAESRGGTQRYGKMRGISAHGSAECRRGARQEKPGKGGTEASGCDKRSSRNAPRAPDHWVLKSVKA